MCPNFILKLKNGVRKQETDFLLNYYTLRINDKAIVKQLNLKLADNFDMFWMCTMPLQVLVLIAMTAIYFTRGEDVRVFIFPLLYVLMFCLWQALRCTRFKSKASILIIFVHNAMFCVLANVLIRGLLPEIFTKEIEDLVFFSKTLETYLFFINCCLVHDIKWFILIVAPLLVLSSGLEAWGLQTLFGDVDSFGHRSFIAENMVNRL
jgi:hypothetical protein